MATVRIILDERKAKKDGTYPVKVRVADNKEFWRIGTSISLTLEDYDSMMYPVKNDKKLSGDKTREHAEKLKTLRIYKGKLDELLVKAQSIINTLQPFNYSTFILRFTQKGNRSDLIFLLQNKSNELEANEQYSNSMLYKQAANTLIKFAKSSNRNVINISEITPKWLSGFENWAFKVTKDEKIKGAKDQFVTKPRYSATTISMYLIRVRAIFNELISNQELPAHLYPFHKPENRYGYKIPRGRNNKRPLKVEEIMGIYNYEPTTQGELFARDMFIFSYLASGMNPIDIFKMKWTDMKDNQFDFIRKKTQKKTQKKTGGVNKITIQLNDHLWDIVKRHGTDRLSSGFVFKIFNDGDAEKDIQRKNRITIGKINPNLKKIAKKIGLDEGISLYYARHAYSNNLMNSEVPIAFISKQLGHTDIKTTQNYLDSFSQTSAIDYQKNLLDHSKIKKEK